MDTATALDRIAELADVLPLDQLGALLAAVHAYGDLRADEAAGLVAAELGARLVDA